MNAFYRMAIINGICKKKIVFLIDSAVVIYFCCKMESSWFNFHVFRDLRTREACVMYIVVQLQNRLNIFFLERVCQMC